MEKEQLEKKLFKDIQAHIEEFRQSTSIRVSRVEARFIDVRGLSDAGPKPALAGVEVEIVLE